jgi:dihydrofolate reductase
LDLGGGKSKGSSTPYDPAQGRVFDHLKTAAWANTTIVRDDIAGTVNRLKAEPGKDLMTFGGAGIANSFMKLGLIDEYRLLVNNIVLGGGTPLFQGGYDRFGLDLLDVQKLDNGSVLLSYKPKGK